MSTKSNDVRVCRPTPTDMQEAADYTRKIGELLSTIEAASIIAAAKVRDLENELENKTTPIKEQVLEYSRALYAFAEANRTELTRGGVVKTVQLEKSGDVRWYHTPGKVELVGKLSDILYWIRKLRRARKLIRYKPEVNKHALLADPRLAQGIPGIEILRYEKFAIRPSGTKTRVERQNDDWSIVIKEKDPIESS